MKRKLCSLIIVAAFAGVASASSSSKPHMLSFGKWTTVKWLADSDGSPTLDLKIRGLYVDGRLKEFTIGAPHEITERLFVVRRALRLNDSLPLESNAPRWIWQPDGWLLADRASGRVSAISLPLFDAVTSSVSWHRDYAAYCGVSDDGQKFYAVVTQLGRRKPVLTAPLGPAKSDGAADQTCPAPTWQRQPPQVTFAPGKDRKATYVVRGHAADVFVDEPDKDQNENEN